MKKTKNKMKKYDVAIIGGGLSGLNAAYRLSNQGKKVILIEKDKILGGMLQSFKINNSFIEKFYHHIIRENILTISLIRELGLHLTWRSASTAFHYKNHFYNLTTPLDLLTFKPLTFIEKMRLGIFLFKIKLIKDPSKLDYISAEKYILQETGKSVYQKFFRPLLSAKYGENIQKISAAWFVERINLRNKRGYKGEILGYLDRGFETLLQELAKNIKLNGGEIITGMPITKINHNNEKIISLVAGNKKIFAENFINTASSTQLLKLSNLSSDYEERLKSLKNQGSICVLIGLKKKISNVYWTNLINEDLSFRALIEHTNFQPYSLYNENIVYLASYPNNSSTLWNLSEETIFNKYFKDLQKIAPVTKDDVNWYRIVKEKEAGLIYDLGILKKLPSVKTPFTNLYLAGMLNSYPDRNIEESIKLSNKVVELISQK